MRMEHPADNLIATADEFKRAMDILSKDGVTLAQFARELDKSQVIVWQWKTGRTPLPRYVAWFLAYRYGIGRAAVAETVAA
jgi:hypothetical protein